MAELVEYRVDASDDGGERLDALRQPLQGGVFVFRQRHVGYRVGDVLFGIVQELHDIGYRLQRPPQVPHLVLLQVGVLQSDAGHRLAHVEKEVQLGLLRSLSESAELAHLVEPFVDRICRVGEVDFVHLLLAQRAQALLLQQPAYFVESYLRFVVFRINHVAKVRIKNEE